jgi:hypothetical protein
LILDRSHGTPDTVEEKREEPMTMLAMVFAVLVQDQLDNPEFKGWAEFKPGSSVTHKISTATGPQGGEQKSTLQSVGNAELVLDVEMSMGGKPLGKIMERKVPAKVPADRAPKDVKKGEEEIEVAGKKLKCTTMEFETMTPNGKTIHMKIWANDEIPGKTARVEISGEGGFKSTMVASAWEKK